MGMRRVVVGAVAVLVVGGVVGCSSGDDDDSGGATGDRGEVVGRLGAERLVLLALEDERNDGLVRVSGLAELTAVRDLGTVRRQTDRALRGLSSRSEATSDALVAVRKDVDRPRAGGVEERIPDAKKVVDGYASVIDRFMAVSRAEVLADLDDAALRRGASAFFDAERLEDWTDRLVQDLAFAGLSPGVRNAASIRRLSEARTVLATTAGKLRAVTEQPYLRIIARSFPTASYDRLIAAADQGLKSGQVDVAGLFRSVDVTDAATRDELAERLLDAVRTQAEA